MDALFNAIVDLLLAICRRTGLSYAEINILIYCGFVPATWALLLLIRQRRLWWILGLQLFAMCGYLMARPALRGFSQRFYDANISALDYLGKIASTSYVGISLLAGVVFPVLIYGALLTAPKRWLWVLYLALVLGNLVYYSWVLKSFL